MKPVKIYLTDWCGWCRRAVALLEERNIPFEAIDVDGDYETRAWLVEATGQRTVPQIFIDGESIGGCTELMALDRSGKLKDMLT